MLCKKPNHPGAFHLNPPQAVFDYVDSLDATAYHRYHLVANYPRRVFLRTPHGPSPLQELGLVPQVGQGGVGEGGVG